MCHFWVRPQSTVMCITWTSLLNGSRYEESNSTWQRNKATIASSVEALLCTVITHVLGLKVLVTTCQVTLNAANYFRVSLENGRRVGFLIAVECMKQFSAWSCSVVMRKETVQWIISMQWETDALLLLDTLRYAWWIKGWVKLYSKSL